MKKPQEGDWIAHRAMMVNGDIVDHEGMVVSLLSVQFTYEDEDGRHRFCMYDDDWKSEGEAPWLR